MRQVVHGRRQVSDLRQELLHPCFELARRRRGPLAQEIHLHRQERQALAQVVVQLPRDPPGFISWAWSSRPASAARRARSSSACAIVRSMNCPICHPTASNICRSASSRALCPRSSCQFSSSANGISASSRFTPDALACAVSRPFITGVLGMTRTSRARSKVAWMVAWLIVAYLIARVASAHAGEVAPAGTQEFQQMFQRSRRPWPPASPGSSPCISSGTARRCSRRLRPSSASI